MAYTFGANENNDYVNMNDGSVKTKQELLNDPNTQKIDTTQSGLSNSLNKLGYQLKAQGNALGSLVTGDKSMMDNAIYNNQISQALAKPTDDITNVHSIGDFGNWATDVAVQNASMLIPGGVIGKGVQYGAEKLASGLLKRSIDASMKDAMFKAGLGATMGFQNLAQNNLTNIQNEGQNMSFGQGLASFGAGAGLGLVEGNALLGLKNRQGLLANMAQTGATAGGVNIAQSAVNRGILGQDLASKEAFNEYLNAGAGGALFGAPFGAFNRAKPEATNIPSTPEANPTTPRDYPLAPIDPNNGLMVNDTLNNGYENPKLKSKDGVDQSFYVDLTDPLQIEGQKRLPFNQDNTDTSNPNVLQIEGQKRLPFNQDNTDTSSNQVNKFKSDKLNSFYNEMNDAINNKKEYENLYDITPEDFEVSKQTYDELMDGFNNNKVKQEFKNTYDMILNNPSTSKLSFIKNVKEHLEKDNSTVFDDISFLKYIQSKANNIDDVFSSYFDEKINKNNKEFLNGFYINKEDYNRIINAKEDGTKERLINNFNDGKITNQKEFDSIFNILEPKSQLSDDNPNYSFMDNNKITYEKSIKNNKIEYKKDNILHNEFGPAIIHKNGSETYFLNGKHLKKEQFDTIIKNGLKDQISKLMSDEDVNNLISKTELNNKLNENLSEKNISDMQAQANETVNKNNEIMSNKEKFDNGSEKILESGTKIHSYEENGSNYERVTFTDNAQQFYKNGELHRDIQDGPAVDFGKDGKEYWVNGKEVNVSFDNNGKAYIKKDNVTKSGKTKLSENANDLENSVKEKLPYEINDIISKNLFDNDTQSAVNTMKEYFTLSKEKQAIIDRVNKGFDNIRKLVNVGIEVIDQEHSPYHSGVDGWFDPVNNKIFIVHSENNKSNLASILRHELFHKGIQNVVKKEGLQSYYDAMDRLYQNKKVREITDRLQNELPSLRDDKYTAIEEALARLIENGEFDKMPIYKQVINFFKTFLNKILGNNEFVSDNDVKAFLDKTEKAVFESKEQEQQYFENSSNIIKFSQRNLNDPKLEESILNAKNDPSTGGFIDILSNAYQKGVFNTLKDKINSDDPWSAMNNSPFGKWTKKFFNTSISGYIMTKDALLKATGPLGSKIIDIQDMKNTLEGNAKAGLNNISQKAMELSKLIPKIDKDTLNVILDTYAYHREKDADGKIVNGNKGVRLDKDTLERELKAKGFSGERLKNAMDLANETRKISDFGIFQDALNDSILRIEGFKNILKQFDPEISNKINDLIDKTIRSEFPFDVNNPDKNTYVNLKNFNENLKQIIGQDTLNKIALSSQENFDFITKSLGDIDNIYGKAGELENRGYIHRDFSGKYTIRMTTQYLQKNGKVVEKTVAIFAHDDKTILQNKINMLEEEFKKNGIDVGEGKKYQLSYETRPNGNFTSIDTHKALLQLASEGITLSDKDMKLLSITQKIGDDFTREFKGYGENQNIQEVAYNYALKKVRDTANNYMQGDINSIIGSLDQNDNLKSKLQDILGDIQGNINYKNSALVDKFKGFTSLMALGFSIPNNIAQLFQTAQIRQSIFEKYGQSAYDYTNSFLNNKKAFSYIKYGSNEIKKTGIKEFDDFIERNKNNELFGSSLNKELFAMSDGFDRNAWSDITNGKARQKVIEEKGYSGLTKEALSLVKEEAYNLNGYFERSLRLTTALQSYEIYKSYKDGKITDHKILEQFKIGGKEKTLDQFIFDNLRTVNGDFSKPNRSAIFNSDLGQILFQFSQWKPLTINAFLNMSTNGKIAFALTNAFAFGGMSGIPFGDDVMNITDELLKMFGAEPFFKNKIEKMSKAIRGDNPNAMNEFASAYIKHGLPLIGDRVGLGSFLPFVRGLTELPDDTNKGIKDLIGPSANTITNLAKGTTQIAQGNITQGLITASPTALKNLAKGSSAIFNGNITSADGVTKMYDTNFLTASAIALGFKTPDILNETDRNNAIAEYKKYRMQERGNIQNDYIKAYRNKDFKAMNDLRQEALKENYDINFGDVLSNSNKAQNQSMSNNAISKLSDKEQQRIKNILG